LARGYNKTNSSDKSNGKTQATAFTANVSVLDIEQESEDLSF